MTCQSCKGTGQVVLLYSSVPCVDCAIQVAEHTITSLPAAPLAKCWPTNHEVMSATLGLPAPQVCPASYKPGDVALHTITKAPCRVIRHLGFNDFGGCDMYLVVHEGETKESLAWASYMKKDSV